MDTIKAIKGRRSIRKYKDIDVDKEIILDIFNAGRLAPSAKNRQPWYFVKVSTEMKNEIADLMMKYAQNKNKDGRLYSVSFTANVIKEAPVLILILKSKDDEWDRYDALSVGAAIENMCLRSTELNLGTLWIGDTDFVENEILDMTKHNDMELVSSLVIGYPNQEPKMRPRKDLEEIVIHRITSDPDKDSLIEPTWLLKKFCLLNDIDKEMKKRDTYQGKYTK